MTAPNKSIETQPVHINLALAVADALEDPATPASLMDALSEIGSRLIDQLSSEKIAPHLRALARVHTEAYPEIETPVLRQPYAKAMVLNGASGK